MEQANIAFRVPCALWLDPHKRLLNIRRIHLPPSGDSGLIDFLINFDRLQPEPRNQAMLRLLKSQQSKPADGEAELMLPYQLMSASLLGLLNKTLDLECRDPESREILDRLNLLLEELPIAESLQGSSAEKQTQLPEHFKHRVEWLLSDKVARAFIESDLPELVIAAGVLVARNSLSAKLKALVIASNSLELNEFQSAFERAGRQDGNPPARVVVFSDKTLIAEQVKNTTLESPVLFLVTADILVQLLLIPESWTLLIGGTVLFLNLQIVDTTLVAIAETILAISPKAIFLDSQAQSFGFRRGPENLQIQADYEASEMSADRALQWVDLAWPELVLPEFPKQTAWLFKGLLTVNLTDDCLQTAVNQTQWEFLASPGTDGSLLVQYSLEKFVASWKKGLPARTGIWVSSAEELRTVRGQLAQLFAGRPAHSQPLLLDLCHPYDGALQALNATSKHNLLVQSSAIVIGWSGDIPAGCSMPRVPLALYSFGLRLQVVLLPESCALPDELRQYLLFFSRSVHHGMVITAEAHKDILQSSCLGSVTEINLQSAQVNCNSTESKQVSKSLGENWRYEGPIRVWEWDVGLSTPKWEQPTSAIVGQPFQNPQSGISSIVGTTNTPVELDGMLQYRTIDPENPLLLHDGELLVSVDEVETSITFYSCEKVELRKYMLGLAAISEFPFLAEEALMGCSSSRNTVKIYFRRVNKIFFRMLQRYFKLVFKDYQSQLSIVMGLTGSFRVSASSLVTDSGAFPFQLTGINFTPPVLNFAHLLIGDIFPKVFLAADQPELLMGMALLSISKSLVEKGKALILCSDTSDVESYIQLIQRAAKYPVLEGRNSPAHQGSFMIHRLKGEWTKNLNFLQGFPSVPTIFIGEYIVNDFSEPGLPSNLGLGIVCYRLLRFRPSRWMAQSMSAADSRVVFAENIHHFQSTKCNVNSTKLTSIYPILSKLPETFHCIGQMLLTLNLTKSFYKKNCRVKTEIFTVPAQLRLTTETELWQECVLQCLEYFLRVKKNQRLFFWVFQSRFAIFVRDCITRQMQLSGMFAAGWTLIDLGSKEGRAIVANTASHDKLTKIVIVGQQSQISPAIYSLLADTMVLMGPSTPDTPQRDYIKNIVCLEKTSIVLFAHHDKVFSSIRYANQGVSFCSSQALKPASDFFRLEGMINMPQYLGPIRLWNWLGDAEYYAHRGSYLPETLSEMVHSSKCGTNRQGFHPATRKAPPYEKTAIVHPYEKSETLTQWEPEQPADPERQKIRADKAAKVDGHAEACTENPASTASGSRSEASTSSVRPTIATKTISDSGKKQSVIEQDD